MSLGTYDLTPKRDSKEMETQKGIKEESVTVIREDGKEILIQTKHLAKHLERGFKLKTITETVKQAVKKVAKKTSKAK